MTAGKLSCLQWVTRRNSTMWVLLGVAVDCRVMLGSVRNCREWGPWGGGVSEAIGGGASRGGVKNGGCGGALGAWQARRMG